jgi:hypothetical protein
MKGWLCVAILLVLLGAMVAVFLTVGSPGVLKASLPPIERLALQRVEFAEQSVIVLVTSTGLTFGTTVEVAAHAPQWRTRSPLG